MFIPIALFGSMFQAQSLPIGPSLPWGASRALQQSVMRVEEFLSKGQFAQAKTFAARLPKRNVVITWDDSLVPATLKRDFAATRDWAISKWKSMVSGLERSYSPSEKLTRLFSTRKPLSISCLTPSVS